MSTLVQYERARKALAEASRISEILPIRDEVEHIKLYAKQINDQALLIEAAAFQMRVEHKLGIVLAAAKEAGQITEGRPKKGDKNTPFPRVTLQEVGIDKNLAKRARHMGSISEQALEVMIEGVRDRIRSGKAKIIDAPSAHEASRTQAARDKDFSPTPPWATRALFEHVFKRLGRLGHCQYQDAWEPACGAGHIAEVAAEYFKSVYASDLYEYGYGDSDRDFLKSDLNSFDWIITNPPFEDRVQKFIVKALNLTGTGVAIFVQLRYLEGIERYETIFKKYAPSLVAPFVERVPLVMGRWDPDASTKTAFMWLVWIKGMPPQAPFWIPPGCSKSLSKPDDIARFTQHPVQKRETKAEAS